MSGRRVIGTRTYLEMHDRRQLVHAKLPDAPWRVERMLDCAPAFWRFLYSEIGRESPYCSNRAVAMIGARLPATIEDT